MGLATSQQIHAINSSRFSSMMSAALRRISPRSLALSFFHDAKADFADLTAASAWSMLAKPILPTTWEELAGLTDSI